MRSSHPSISSSMDSHMKRNNALLLAGGVILTVLAIASLFVGKYPLSLPLLLAGDPMQRRVFVTLRLTRTAAAVIGGCGLGVTGFVYQTVFRNPLASPDIIGVSSGVSAGAAAGILFFGTAAAITACSFAGALAAVSAALILAGFDRTGSKATIVLSGIAVHALAQTVLMYLKLTADPERELASIEYWIMGGLNGISANRAAGNLMLCAVCIFLLFLLHRQTLLLSAEEGEARMLGAAVGRLRFLVLTAATLAVSAIVSLTGLISFVGLLAPHGARLLTRDNRLKTMALSGLLGGVLLCLADILARSTAASELPVSIFTSLLGAPFLVGLVLRKGGRQNA